MNKGYNYSTIITPQATQVILTGKISDGTLCQNGVHFYYMTNSIHKEYIEKKKKLLGEICGEVTERTNRGYKINQIFQTVTRNHPIITNIAITELENILPQLTNLGLAIWFYDDGSLHQKKHFYNLCTHSFTEEEHEDIIIPYLNKALDIKVTKRIERKKDGRIFFYCGINKRDGADNIIKLLNKYPIKCFKYKTLNEEELSKSF